MMIKDGLHQREGAQVLPNNTPTSLKYLTSEILVNCQAMANISCSLAGGKARKLH